MDSIFQNLIKLKENDIDMMLFSLVATSQLPVSRSELAKKTGLSKMTISRHITDMIQRGMIIEREEDRAEWREGGGRTPTSLYVSDAYPCLCGILIKRNYIELVITNIAGKVLDMLKQYFEAEMTSEELKDLMISMYDKITSRNKRAILGCGIAAIGPVDSSKGIILNPADFFGITNFHAVDIMHEHTGLPTYLLHDADAGAIAERIYGKGASYDNYVYIHIEAGIGLGYILNGQLVQGVHGYNGEIGHTSINFSGPKCVCGNYGCLEVYANINQMRKRVSEVLPFLPDSELRKISQPSWEDIINLAVKGDLVALAALDDYCKYLTFAIINLLNMIFFPIIILGYDSLKSSTVITKIIQNQMKEINSTLYKSVRILSSGFNNAPLIGAAAVVAKKVFEQKIEF